MTASETVYRYVDENDVTLYEVVRTYPKRFVQRVPLGSGLYEYKLNGVRRVPFRLPELRAAIKAGRTIFVVEGEKDADALRALDFCATTSAQGASWSGLPISLRVLAMGVAWSLSRTPTLRVGRPLTNARHCFGS